MDCICSKLTSMDCIWSKLTSMDCIWSKLTSMDWMRIERIGSTFLYNFRTSAPDLTTNISLGDLTSNSFYRLESDFYYIYISKVAKLIFQNFSILFKWFYYYKGTVSLISRYPQCKDGNIRLQSFVCSSLNNITMFIIFKKWLFSVLGYLQKWPAHFYSKKI